jgi:hypothetical protein
LLSLAARYRSHIGAGSYHLHLVLSAAETKGKRFVLQIAYNGCWELDEAQMFEAIRIRLT